MLFYDVRASIPPSKQWRHLLPILLFFTHLLFCIHIVIFITYINNTNFILQKLVNIYCHEIVDAPQLGGLPAHDDIILVFRFKIHCPQILNFKG